MFVLGNLSSVDPTETAGGLKPPNKVIPGVYKFRRVILDTEISMEEPPGAPVVVALEANGKPRMEVKITTYIFEVFEFERYLKQVLRLQESVRMRLMDMLWNFLYVAWNSETNRIWCPRSSNAEVARG